MEVEFSALVLDFRCGERFGFNTEDVFFFFLRDGTSRKGRTGRTDDMVSSKLSRE